MATWRGAPGDRQGWWPRGPGRPSPKTPSPHPSGWSPAKATRPPERTTAADAGPGPGDHPVAIERGGVAQPEEALHLAQGEPPRLDKMSGLLQPLDLPPRVQPGS